MADPKIKLTWDDLNSRKVDTRLKEQTALERNRQYAGMDESNLPSNAGSRTPLLLRLWRNSVFALCLFGLLGGIAAWACGASLRFQQDVETEAESYMQDINRLNDAAERGVTPRHDADLAIEAILERGRRDNPYFAVMSDPRYNDPALEAEKQQKLAAIVADAQLRQFIHNVLAYGAAGVMISLMLAIALPVTEKNLSAVVVNGSVGAALGLVGGVAVSLCVDWIYQKIATGPGGQSGSTRQFIARVGVWGAMGLFLTIAPGIVMRNWKKFVIGLLGGLIGGLVGGVLYDPVTALVRDTRWSDLRLAELCALAAIGLFAGLSTGVIENAAKSGWVRVVSGLIAGKQFILYRNPTFLGSEPDCQIYLFRDPKVGRRHAAIHIVPGGFELEDLPLGEPTYINGKPVSRSRLKSGDRIQIGASSLIFQEKTPTR